MQVLVADTSGLVSLGIAADQPHDPLEVCLTTYDVWLPELVVDELREIGSYDDEHGRAAETILERTDEVTVQSVPLDDDFPLDDGENEAVTLANDGDAELFLCDEFNRLGLIHASLANTRLLTTPTVLSVLVRTDQLRADAALEILGAISKARSWNSNEYVQRAQLLLETS